MKQNIFFILILFLAFQIGCKGKDIPTPTTPELKLGTISNLAVNGNSLPRSGMELIIDGHYYYRCNTSIYGLFITHQTVTFTNIQEYFDFSMLPINQTGKIKLYNSQGIIDTCNLTPRSDFFMMAGKDRLVATYDLLKTSDNYIFIESFDKTKNEVTGTMNVTYIARGTSETSRAIYPDTLRFENAKFTVPLNN